MVLTYIFPYICFRFGLLFPETYCDLAIRHLKPMGSRSTRTPPICWPFFCCDYVHPNNQFASNRDDVLVSESPIKLRPESTANTPVLPSNSTNVLISPCSTAFQMRICVMYLYRAICNHFASYSAGEQAAGRAHECSKSSVCPCERRLSLETLFMPTVFTSQKAEKY